MIAEDVECPSLSPDETRVAFKRRQGDNWRLHVLDLDTGREYPLAETRSVDDQVEWLDDDGRGRPRVYRRDALSPAVVRQKGLRRIRSAYGARRRRSGAAPWRPPPTVVVVTGASPQGSE